MIGKLIPAGTGMKRYKNIELDYGVNAEIMENYEREQELAALAAARESASYEVPVQTDMVPEEEIFDDETAEGVPAAEPEIVELD